MVVIVLVCPNCKEGMKSQVYYNFKKKEFAPLTDKRWLKVPGTVSLCTSCGDFLIQGKDGYARRISFTEEMKIPENILRIFHNARRQILERKFKDL